MDWDDVRPKPQARIAIGEDLKALSIDDLRQRITALDAERTRIGAEIDARLAHGRAVDGIFKK